MHFHPPSLPCRPARAAAVAGTAAAALLALAGPAGAMSTAGPAGAAGTPRAAGTAGPGQSSASAQILLLTGDRLTAGTGAAGGTTAAVAPAPGQSGDAGLITLGTGRQAYAIPGDALPYLGRGLDPALFSLTALRQAESGGRLPVRVSFAGKAPRIPGVTITQSGAGTADGYLTAASAPQFGAALARQFRSDHAAGGYGTRGLFANGTGIALASSPASAARAALVSRAAPGFKDRTLTMTGTNLAGKPDNFDSVLVFNAADPARFFDPIASENFFFHGSAKFSVPVGTYWAIGDFSTFSKSGTSGAERLAVLPQFTVGNNGGRAHVDERSATSQLTFATPRPAYPSQIGITIERIGPQGSGTAGFYDGGAFSEWISPTSAKPSVGSLRTWSSGLLTSPAHAAGTPYLYDLQYPGPAGIIPGQHFTVSPSSLATVSERYDATRPSNGGWGLFGGTLQQWEGILFTPILPVRVPGPQTQYLTAGPGMIWQELYFPSIDGAGVWFSSSHTLPAGGQASEEWNRYPLNPAPYLQLLSGQAGRALPVQPSVFRTGNALTLAMSPFGDNQPGHDTYQPVNHQFASYAAYQNGSEIGHGNLEAITKLPAVQLSSRPSAMRYVVTAGLGTAAAPSTVSTTAWTWRSSPQPGATVPASWYCSVSFTGGKIAYHHRCAAQPLLTLAYQVQGLRDDETAPPGQQVIGLTVGTVAPAAGVAVGKVRAQVSADGGHSWHPVTVTAAGHGTYRLAFPAAAGQQVSLRVSASGAGGSSVEQTIVNAYGVRQ